MIIAGNFSILIFLAFGNIEWYNRRPPTAKTGDLIPNAKHALEIVAEHFVI